MNQKLNPIAEKVMTLLLQNPGEVERYVDSLKDALEEAQAAARQAEANLMAARNIMMLARAHEVSVPEQVTLSDQADAVLIPGEASRRGHVLRAAEDLALAHELVSIEQVLAELRSRGIELGGSRPGTAVGNILIKDPNWERVGEGKFKRREGATTA